MGALHEAGDVRVFNGHKDGFAAGGLFAGDGGDGGYFGPGAEVAEGEHKGAVGGAEGKFVQNLRIEAVGFGEADGEGIEQVAFVNAAHGAPGQADGDGVVYLVGGGHVAEHGVAVGGEFHGVGASGQIHDHFAGAGFGFDEVGDLAGEGVEAVVVGAVQFDGEVGADAFEQFIKADADGLVQFEVLAGDGAVDGGGDEAGQFGFGNGVAVDLPPFGAGAEANINIVLVGTLGISGDLGHAEAGEEVLDFGDGGADGQFGLFFHFEGAGEADLRVALDFHHQPAFIQSGEKIRAEAGAEEGGAGGEQEGGGQDGPAEAAAGKEQFFVKPAQRLHEAGFAHANVPAQAQRAEGRHKGEGEDEGGGEQQHDGLRERAEHAALDAAESEHGHVGADDDEHADEHGLAHLAAGFDDEGEAVFRAGAGLEFARDIFDHDDGVIYDHAEINGTEGHEAAHDAAGGHGGEAEGEGEDEDGGDDQGGAEVA